MVDRPSGDRDDREAILAQLQGMTAAPAMTREELLARLTREPGPDPLDAAEYTGDLVADSAAEVDAISAAFRDRARREDERFQLATDSEYWFCVCFRTREDKDAFLRAAGLWLVGDKYLDGYQVARALALTNDPNP